MTDPEPAPVPTLLERMIASRMSEDRARGWIDAGRVVVDGEVVTDPDATCPKGQAGARWEISGG